ncbi:MAG: class II glutamine amidotransferase [Fervidobacterium sp.]
MCRMAGFSFNTPQNISNIIGFTKIMAQFGIESPHNDGWGCVLSDGSKTLQYKSIKPIYQDDLGLTKIDEEFKIGIIHARLASKGLPKTTLQLHPFHKKGMYFAHNGTIKSAKRENVYQSDTYEYFENISEFKSLYELAKNIESFAKENEFTGMNFIIFDEIEETLYVCCLYKDTPKNREYFTLHYYEEDGNFIVYSEKYSPHFKPMENGEIFKIRDGKITEKAMINL